MSRIFLAPALMALVCTSAFGQCEATLVMKVSGSDTGPNDAFGLSVGIDRDVIVAGAVWDSPKGSQSGSAYVFERTGDTWAQVVKLVPDNGNAFAHFGRSAAVGGNTVVIGAQGEDTGGADSGAAYVYERIDGVWTPTQMLKAADAAPGDDFGWNCDIDGDTIIVSGLHNDDLGGDSGAAYIFVRQDGTWIQQAKLLPGDGGPDDQFGHDVAISADRAVVGAYHHNEGGDNAGAAYIFERTGDTWTQTAKLTALDKNEGYHFGRFVELDGDVALIGSPLWWPADYGASYVFRLEGGAWNQEVKLHSETVKIQEWFGSSVAIQGDMAISGSFYITGNHPGKARIHKRMKDGSWVGADVFAPGGVNGDGFGRALTVSGDTLVVAANQEDDHGLNAGSIYIFELDCTPFCPGDFNDDGALNVLDFVAFQLAFVAGDPLADVNDDGMLSVLDFVVFQILFQEGCS
jgi:hypothetical protein